MIMPSRVQFSKFTHKLSSHFDHMIGESSAAYVVTGVSILTHDGTMALLDNKSEVQQGNQIVEHSSSRLPGINRSFEFPLTRPSRSCFLGASESILKPDDKFFITTCYFQTAMPLVPASIFALLYSAYIKTAFTVYNPSKICNIFWRLSGMVFNKFSHYIPFVYYYSIINEEIIHGERLSEKTLNKGCDSLTSIRKMERMSRRACPA